MNDSLVRRGNAERGEKTPAIIEAELDPESLGGEEPAERFSILVSHSSFLVLLIDPSTLAITSMSTSASTITSLMRRGKAGEELRELPAQSLAMHDEINQAVFFEELGRLETLR